MANQGTGVSGGRGKRQSSLPSSLIPLMYTGPQQQRGSASPSQTENPESTENPASSTAQFTFIPPSPIPAFTLRPIDSPADVPTPDERQLQTSRLQSASPEHDQQDSQRAGPSSILVDTQIETRLGGETTNYGFQPPPEPTYTSFTFPPVPRYQHMPYSYYGENDAGPSTIGHTSRETSISRRMIVRGDTSHLPVSTWPRSERRQSPLGEPERRKWTNEQLRHEEQQRQRQRPSEPRRPASLPSQQGESFIAEPSTSVPTYRPAPTQSNLPVVPSEGLQLTTHPGPEPPPVYYANPYVAQTQSYTQIAPQFYPRYYDVPPIATAPSSRQGYQLQYTDQSVTPAGDQSYGSEDEAASATSRRRGKEKSGTTDEDGGRRSSRAKGKRTRAAEEGFDEDDEDDAPRRKVPRKTEVACDFCRRRKLRCDGVRPTCRTCETRKEPCTYVDHVRRRGPGKAPKGTKKLAKRRVVDIDPFTTMMDLSHLNRPFVARPESVASIDTLPRYSPPIGGSLYATPPQVPPRNVPPPHLPSQSPGASTSEREAGPSGERRHRKRTASQHDRSKRSRRDPETEETDDTSHDPRDDDDDMPYDG